MATSKNHLVRLLIPATKATPGAPVGPALGQRGVKQAEFCKQFNDRTTAFLAGVPLPTYIRVKPDRTFTFTFKPPQAAWLLLKAAGLEKGSSKPGSIYAGEISLKHVYEIAKIKKHDAALQDMDLRGICTRIIGQAQSMGIRIVK
ncbi:hypothetical protein HK096_003737 [Nowakowskiella sp. JEL0078]|nr:hypothetical protein HK096_003737 [Nowakowskiella sp. JEL0078]